ncbi:MAG: hypothetical protein U0821_19820 [Chloroflexota bacterium]
MDKSAPAVAALVLDDRGEQSAFDDLTYETGLLREAIRCLAPRRTDSPDLKVFGELRHQVHALCTVIKTQHALAGRSAGAADLVEKAIDALDQAQARSGEPDSESEVGPASEEVVR